MDNEAGPERQPTPEELLEAAAGLKPEKKTVMLTRRGEMPPQTQQQQVQQLAPPSVPDAAKSCKIAAKVCAITGHNIDVMKVKQLNPMTQQPFDTEMLICKKCGYILNEIRFP